MPRRRLGVAFLLDPPVAAEVDGLRRALGDPALDRIAPHLTLVPPVNVAEADLPEVLGLMRRAAATVPGPLELDLGPPATFLPDNPVLYLQVSGEPEAPERLRRLRETVFAGPLHRPIAWPFLPHVTLADHLEPAAIAAGVPLLRHFRAAVRFDRLVLLEESGRPRRWVPLADARLGPRQVVGRGGLELELTFGRQVDPEAAALLVAALSELAVQQVALPAALLPASPEAAALLAASPEAATRREAQPGDLPVAAQGPGAEARIHGEPGGEADRGPARPTDALVCTARREGAVVGVGAAWYEGRRGYLGVAVGPACRHQGIGTHVLVRLESALFDEGWDGPGLEPLGPPAFYQGRSRTARR